MSDSNGPAPVPGVRTLASPLSAHETVERLKEVIAERGLKLFALIDHSGGAREAGLAMNESKLLIFGHPRGGTPLMVAAPLAALDLPLKALVWADEAGAVWVSYYETGELGLRHHVPNDLLAPLHVIDAVVSSAVS